MPRQAPPWNPKKSALFKTRTEIWVKQAKYFFHLIYYRRFFEALKIIYMLMFMVIVLILFSV